MMMRMLEQGGMPVVTDGLRESDIDNPNGYYEFEAAKGVKQDSSWLSGASGRAVKMVYQLLYDLPADQSYRVLMMRRKIEEVLASQRKMLERLGKPGGDIPDATMARLFADQLAKFDSWIKNRPNFSVKEIDYNRMVADPETLVPEIDDFLGGGLDRDAMIRVVDRSLYRNRVG
jgi:hypothetical protein